MPLGVSRSLLMFTGALCMYPPSPSLLMADWSLVRSDQPTMRCLRQALSPSSHDARPQKQGLGVSLLSHVAGVAGGAAAASSGGEARL